MSGVGNFVVQSVTINGKQRTLPTISSFTDFVTAQLSYIEINNKNIIISYQRLQILCKK